jgi:hypothetical protein
MNLKQKSTWLFIGLLFFMVLPAIISTPFVIGMAVTLGSLLVVIQALIILRDNS